MAGGGVQPIIGCQLGLRRTDAQERRVGQKEGRTPDPDQLVLLCQSETGYKNLIKLVSKAYLETDPGEAPQVSLEQLAPMSEGLICLTGGPAGRVGRLLAEGQTEHAEQALSTLMKLFPGRLYVELMRHGLPVEDKIEPGLIDLAYKHDLPLVATNECFFVGIDMYEAHDALICIAEGAYVSMEDRRRLTPEHRFKTAEEMRELFADLPEAVDNTLVIARRCAYMVEKVAPLLPRKAQEGETEEDVLRRMAREGLEKRLAAHVYTEAMGAEEREAKHKEYFERLDYEIGVIVQMGFPGYFLIVADFIQWAKEHGIPVGPGRGSGAGSCVAWALTITDLDPIRFGLLFERFLNPERVSMPDFDIDFCQDRREEVIRYVQERVRPRQKVAQIITFGKLQARAVRSATSGGCCRCPIGQVDRICKLVPNNAGPERDHRPRRSPPNRSLQRDDQRKDESVAMLIDLAQKPRRALPPRLDPRRRRGDRRPAARRTGPAVPRPALGHAGHPVQHEVRRKRPVW